MCTKDALTQQNINITSHNNFDAEIHGVPISNEMFLDTHYIYKNLRKEIYKIWLTISYIQQNI